jgi:peptide/nickel transport system permease protein
VRYAAALVVSRVAWMAAILLSLSFLLFGVLSALPGDPVDLLVTSNPNVRPEDVQRLKQLRGLDKPWPVRWARWLIGHPEAREPPRTEHVGPFIVAMPPEGPARVSLPLARGDAEVLFDAPGVHRVPTVVVSPTAEPTRPPLDGLRVFEVLVAPPPSPDEDSRGVELRDHRAAAGGQADLLDEGERQAAGSTERAQAARASEEALAEAARRIGRVLPVAAPRSFSATDGRVQIDEAELCPGSGLRFEVVEGPGRFIEGRYVHRFEGPGQSAVIYRVTAAAGATAAGAFTVDHGFVPDPDRFHRGALFILLGDTEALGYSSTYKRAVWELLFGPPVDGREGRALTERAALSLQRFGRVQNTLALMLPALLISLLFAIPLGVLAASRPGGLVDRAVMALSTLGLSMPAFWLGIMAMVVFAAQLQVLPAGGIQTPGLPPELGLVLADRIRHAILPVSVLAFAYAAPWIRYVRSGVAEVLPQDFVRTARAKGAPPGVVLRRHALRNALLPLVTVIALAAPQMFAGALLTETVFAWPGVGRLQYEAILNNDSYVAIVVFLVSATLVLLGNLAADLLYLVVDPRLRRRGRRRGERP